MTISSHMRKSEVGEVRPSQTLTTFGIGSLVDLPNMSVIVMGLDDWPNAIYGLPLFARKAGCSETKVRLHAYIRPISEQYALALMTFARGCLISSTV